MNKLGLNKLGLNKPRLKKLIREYINACNLWSAALRNLVREVGHNAYMKSDIGKILASATAGEAKIIRGKQLDELVEKILIEVNNYNKYNDDTKNKE